MNDSSSLARRLASAASVSIALAAVVSCGSRTGLFGPEPSLQPLDAALDSPPPPDAGADVDAAVDAPLPCLPGTFTFQLATPQLMFVLDRSGSMSFSLNQDVEPPAGRPTRWTTLRDALERTIVPFDQELAMGAKFFPEANADPFDAVASCATSTGVGIAPGLGNAHAILDVFTTTSPVGGTPTAAALQAAATYLTSSRGVARAMVLATDGQPNCNGALDGRTCVCTSTSPEACTQDPLGGYGCLDDVATVTLIGDIFGARRVPVYVIGIGGVTFGAVLDAMAVAGGRARAGSPKYYAATTAPEMTSAFESIRDGVARCTYITPSAPTDPNAITVVVAGKRVGRDATHTAGWDWVDQAYGQLQLFGTACADATKANVSGTVACKDDD